MLWLLGKQRKTVPDTICIRPESRPIRLKLACYEPVSKICRVSHMKTYLSKEEDMMQAKKGYEDLSGKVQPFPKELKEIYSISHASMITSSMCTTCV